MSSQTPYRQLPAARRVALVTRAIKSKKEMRAALASRMVTRGGGFRPATLLQWPADKLAREVVRLGAESAEDELNLLNLLYVEFEPQIQAAFLDAAGVKHTDGVMPEDLEPPFATADLVAKAAAAVVAQFADDGRHYLLTIAKYNGDGWPALDAVIAEMQPKA